MKTLAKLSLIGALLNPFIYHPYADIPLMSLRGKTKHRKTSRNKPKAFYKKRRSRLRMQKRSRRLNRT